MDNNKFPDREIKQLIEKIAKLELENERLWSENRRAQVPMFQSRIYKLAKRFSRFKFFNFKIA